MVTRRMMDSRNVTFIKTPSRLFSPSLEETSQHIFQPSNGMDGHNYIPDDDFLRDLRDYASVLEPLRGTSLTTSRGLALRQFTGS